MKEEYYSLITINENFPHIQYVEGENLNIEDAHRDILIRCWKDLRRFKDVSKIAQTMKVSERHIYKLAKKYHLPKRK